jgi:FMN phosphatase YigB (HAD superfamily)
MTEMKDKETKEITKIPWSQSIWFFDVDDTLVDTAKNSQNASEGINGVFSARFDAETGKKIQDRFNDFYNLMYEGYKVKKEMDWQNVSGGKTAFDELNTRVADHQKNLVAKYGTHKKWSREIFIKLATDDIGMSVTPELVHEAADAYWMTLARLSKPFPETMQLIDQIKSHHRPIYLITGSDARLKMREDKQFEYIPEYSEGLKRERIALLREEGIEFNGLSIGDPEDKPHPDFFQKGIKVAEDDLGHPIDLGNAIMLGDSFAGDLQTPKEQLGFGLVVLFQKDKNSTEVVDKHQLTTGKLNEVGNFLT